MSLSSDIYINMNIKLTNEDNGEITTNFLKKLIKHNSNIYYSNPSLNETFYLHYKDITKINNLSQYVELKVLYLEGNNISKIQGLSTLTNLKCLYLQQNLIQQISNISSLTHLISLNLNDNLISRIEGLEELKKLDSLQLKRNRIGKEGLKDVEGILQCLSLSIVDLSDNRIETAEIVDEILVKMDRLCILYVQNNLFNKKIPHYRKHLISKITTLMCLDDNPIFQDERRYAEAWKRGGLEEERRERQRYKLQKRQKEKEERKQTQERVQRLKEQCRMKRQENSSSETSGKEESLPSYNTPSDDDDYLSELD